jgi:hypothetical protein
LYDTRDKAINCAVGDIELVQCFECGLVFNHAYRKELLDYDNNYNSVRSYSETYKRYLGRLVGLCSAGVEAGAKILEVGCGDGGFLKTLCAATGAKGTGFDPACREGDSNEYVILRQECFGLAKSQGIYDMIILRHVLEHMPEPFDFLRSISKAGVLVEKTRLWVEVPDFEWILENGSYYDITYEHCNYFCKQSLGSLLAKAGFEVVSIKNVFDGQYILGQLVYTGEQIENEISTSLELEQGQWRFCSEKQMHDDLMGGAGSVCVWGASGKGVIFLSGLSESMLEKVGYVVDINPDKHGKFLPVSGKKVEDCEVLKEVGSDLLVIVMNGIYENEISAKLKEMNVKASVYVA